MGKYLLAGLFFTFFTTNAQVSLTIVDNLLKFGYKYPDTIRNPDVIIIHASYCPSKKDSFNLECVLNLYKKYQVSAHYIIDRDGIIYRLVKEEHISYHGGKGLLPDGGTKINTRSIGIELINTKVSDYTDLQYSALVNLVADIKSRYQIKYVLGHKDIAPDRKTDPWNFDWIKFNTLMQGTSTNSE